MSLRSMHDMTIARAARIEIAYTPWNWSFAEERRAEIDAHFAELRRARPALWNGRVLLLHRHVLEGDRLSGSAGAADFASFLAWRDWGYPGPPVRNFFGMGALRAADGAFLLGVMGDHTANPGRIYFASGTPEPGDVAHGLVDVTGSVLRELREETGLAPGEVEAEEGWTLVVAEPRIAMMKLLHAREPASVLRERMLAHLAREAAPELADIRIVRGPQDLDPMMPAFIHAFLRRVWL